MKKEPVKPKVVQPPVAPLLTETELLDPNISNKTVSEVLYRGMWEEISILKNNVIFKGYNEEMWPYTAKNYEFFATPWYPLVLSFVILFSTLFFEVADGSISLGVAVLSIIYITYGIPKLNQRKENNRIKWLDELLLDSPYHRELFMEAVVDDDASGEDEYEEVVIRRIKKKKEDE